MDRWAVLIFCTGALGACGTFNGALPNDPARDGVGVAAARPAAEAATPVAGDALKVLQWKADQTCTGGYTMVRQDLIQAEAERQIVDWELLCKPYRLNALGVSAPDLWPF